jgi:hypothetical protein
VLCFVFLRLVYPMLPISLNCPFLIAPSAFSMFLLEILSFQKLLKNLYVQIIVINMSGLWSMNRIRNIVVVCLIEEEWEKLCDATVVIRSWKWKWTDNTIVKRSRTDNTIVKRGRTDKTIAKRQKDKQRSTKHSVPIQHMTLVALLLLQPRW